MLLSISAHRSRSLGDTKLWMRLMWKKATVHHRNRTHYFLKRRLDISLGTRVSYKTQQATGKKAHERKPLRSKLMISHESVWLRLFNLVCCRHLMVIMWNAQCYCRLLELPGLSFTILLPEKERRSVTKEYLRAYFIIISGKLASLIPHDNAQCIKSLGGVLVDRLKLNTFSSDINSNTVPKGCQLNSTMFPNTCIGQIFSLVDLFSLLPGLLWLSGSLYFLNGSDSAIDIYRKRRTGLPPPGLDKRLSTWPVFFNKESDIA